MLLKGAGRSFCAGNDLGDLGGVFNDGDNSKFRSDTVERLANLPMPVIAAVQGHCLTGGLELALAADIIIAPRTRSSAIRMANGIWCRCGA